MKGLFASVIHAFMQTDHWRGLSESTRALWGRELVLASQPDVLGNLTVSQIKPSHVLAHLDGLASKPGKQAAALAALREVDKWAYPRDRIDRPITYGISVDGPRGGHVPWPDEAVALVEQHARPDIAAAVTLAANTGQRGSDLVRMLPTDLEIVAGRLGINVRQRKTKVVVWVPFTEPMLAAWERWPKRPGPLLRNTRGGVWTRQVLGAAWKHERDNNPALAPLRAIELHSTHDTGLVMHGLRGTACQRLRLAGCTTRQIGDMVGMDEETVKGYVRFTDQRENALAAATKLDQSRNPNRAKLSENRS